MKNFYCGRAKWDFSWKTAYAMILANNSRWVCSHLFGSGKVSFEALANGKFPQLTN